MRISAFKDLLDSEFGMSVSERTLRRWAQEGLLSSSRYHSGGRGRPPIDLPDRAISEACGLWAIAKLRPAWLHSSSKKAFDRFLDQIVSVYATQRVPGTRLARFDEYNEKPIWAFFAPFDVATFDASPTLNKPLVAQVVIVLEKLKKWGPQDKGRRWPLDKKAKVIFNWRLKTVRKTSGVIGSDEYGIYPTFFRADIELEESPNNELVFRVLPCEVKGWEDGATVLRVTGNEIKIDDESNLLLRFFKPKRYEQERAVSMSHSSAIRQDKGGRSIIRFGRRWFAARHRRHSALRRRRFDQALLRMHQLLEMRRRARLP